MLNKIPWLKFPLLLFFGVPYLVAQNSITGVLTGKVVDRKSGQPLPGVNIIIKNTVLGASTNLDGEFVVTRVQPGLYTVMASMIGYKLQVQKEVKITAGDTTRLNFALEETVIETAPVIVTATRKSKSLAETPNSVSVISARDIRTRNSFDVRDALKYAPGVSFVAGQVNIRGTTGYSRGAGSRVLLLTDGVPTMPGDSGDIKWDLIPYMVVERVEVVKGAASALYGSSAIGGVLNLITKEPANKPEFTVRLSGGIYDDPAFKEWKWTDRPLVSNQQDIYFSSSSGKLGYIIALGRRESRGYRQNGQFLRTNVFNKLRFQFNPATHLEFTGAFARDDHGEAILWLKYLGQPKNPLRVPDEQAGDTILSKKLYLNTTFSQLASQNFAYKLRLSYYRNRFQNHFVDNHDFSKSQRFRLEYQADVQVNVRYSLTTGFEGIADVIEGNFFGEREGYSFGSYLQNEYKFTDRLSTTAGLRFDFQKVIGGQREYQLSPRLGLIYHLSEVTTLRGSVGRGFRAPSMAELFSETSASGFQVVPNPDLDAESSWSAEIGINTSIKNHILLNMAIYQERYFDFINPSLGFQGTTPIIQFKNVQDARIRGIETNLTTSWFRNHLTTVLSYVFVDPKDLQTGRLLTYRPRHLLTLSARYTPDIFEIGVDYRYASRLKAEQVELFPQDKRVAQKVVDARAGLHWRNYTLMFNVENLLNYNYTQIERNLEPIRQYSLTLQAEF
ncbi:MAG: TonB-dependent receptor [Calditrichaeota bacterium]|nr:MAG: TonB-dependent receptor [Calditrichota bacterium]